MDIYFCHIVQPNFVGGRIVAAASAGFFRPLSDPRSRTRFCAVFWLGVFVDCVAALFYFVRLVFVCSLAAEKSPPKRNAKPPRPRRLLKSGYCRPDIAARPACHRLSRLSPAVRCLPPAVYRLLIAAFRASPVPFPASIDCGKYRQTARAQGGRQRPLAASFAAAKILSARLQAD